MDRPVLIAVADEPAALRLGQETLPIACHCS
jgi:hypothetical protein